jgi:hypothetical protein
LNARAGYIEFKNAVFLLVSTPRTAGYKVKNYNNEWVNDGQILTWFFRERDWNKQGTNSPATKLTSADNSVVLFVWLGTKKFICYGRCGIEEVDPILWRSFRRYGEVETDKSAACAQGLGQATPL